MRLLRIVRRLIGRDAGSDCPLCGKSDAYYAFTYSNSRSAGTNAPVRWTWTQ